LTNRALRGDGNAAQAHGVQLRSAAHPG